MVFCIWMDVRLKLRYLLNRSRSKSKGEISFFFIFFVGIGVFCDLSGEVVRFFGVFRG